MIGRNNIDKKESFCMSQTKEKTRKEEVDEALACIDSLWTDEERMRFKKIRWQLAYSKMLRNDHLESL